MKSVFVDYDVKTKTYGVTYGDHDQFRRERLSPRQTKDVLAAPEPNAEAIMWHAKRAAHLKAKRLQVSEGEKHE